MESERVGEILHKECQEHGIESFQALLKCSKQKKDKLQ